VLESKIEIGSERMTKVCQPNRLVMPPDLRLTGHADQDGIEPVRKLAQRWRTGKIQFDFFFPYSVASFQRTRVHGWSLPIECCAATTDRPIPNTALSAVKECVNLAIID
jgi:hypothetical protein